MRKPELAENAVNEEDIESDFSDDEESAEVGKHSFFFSQISQQIHIPYFGRYEYQEFEEVEEFAKNDRSKVRASLKSMELLDSIKSANSAEKSGVNFNESNEDEE